MAKKEFMEITLRMGATKVINPRQALEICTTMELYYAAISDNLTNHFLGICL